MKPVEVPAEIRPIVEQARAILWGAYPGNAPAGTIVLAGERGHVDTILGGALPSDESPLAAAVLPAVTLSFHVMRWAMSTELSPQHIENAKGLCRYLRECFVAQKPPRIIAVTTAGFHIIELQPDTLTTAPGGSA